MTTQSFDRKRSTPAFNPALRFFSEKLSWLGQHQAPTGWCNIPPPPSLLSLFFPRQRISPERRTFIAIGLRNVQGFFIDQVHLLAALYEVFLQQLGMMGLPAAGNATDDHQWHLLLFWPDEPSA
jgi:hypothetical protein